MGLRIFALAPPDHAEGLLGRGVLTGADPASLYNACRYSAELAVNGEGAWGDSNWNCSRAERRESVLLIDSLKEGMPEFISRIQKIKPNILLIGSMTLCFPGAIECAKKAKELFGDDICIVLGGRHCNETVYKHLDTIQHHPGSPLELMSRGVIDPVFDIVVSGQGEYLIAEIGNIVYELEKSNNKVNQAKYHLENIKETRGKWLAGFISDGIVEVVENDGFAVNYNELQPPCLMFGISESFDVFKGRPTAHVFSDTGGGCAYDCNFCSERISVMGTPVQKEDSVLRLVKQFKAAIQVVEEDYPDSPGASAFVEDSILLLGSNKKLNELISLLTEEKIDIKFGAQLTVDQVNTKHDILQRLKEVGLEYLFIGVETIDPNIANTLSKNSKKNKEVDSWFDRTLQALFKLHELQIKSCVALVFGLGETHESRLHILQKLKMWRKEFGFPARISMNWGVQHPLKDAKLDGSDYTFHEWGAPPGPYLDAFKNFGESSLIYPMYGQPRPILSELVEIAKLAKNVVEQKPNDNYYSSTPDVLTAS